MVPTLIFDCDGVLADTERDGHLPAFNQTFGDFSLPVHWSDADYADLVKIGGGKERMRAALTNPSVQANGSVPSNEAALTELIGRLHAHKTAIYTQMVAEGALPGRPGIARIVADAEAAGWGLAVASTSAEASVRAVLEYAVGADHAESFTVFAGDVVPHKKPAPDIYLLALSSLGIGPHEAIVVEDSRNGFLAAQAAGLATVVTVSTYTADEDFTGADLVVSSLGDPDGEQARVLADPHGLHPGPVITLTDIARILPDTTPDDAPTPDPSKEH